jgi:nitrite reductase (cytochrome c-552)
LSRKAKLFKALLVMAALFFVFITLRIVILKPQSSVKLAKISANEYDPLVWGKSYPLEYKSYQKNLEMAPSPTGYGDSRKIQHSIKEPEILTNFKGMAFSKDYAEDRGHPYAIQDLKETKRINPNSPGACMTCKTANLIDIYKDMGWKYAKTPLAQLFPRMKHPVTCANCHDPATMNLRVINPAFIEAMQKKGIDVKKAPREQMRSYVCGQCHAEYYFEPGTSRVIFPWDKGFLPEQMYAYYSEKPGGFNEDWLHPDSKAKMLKAQHPDFETWSNGTHGKAGVSCADCHMPFMRENGQKYTSHWITSPMKHVKSSCMTCHSEDEKWLLERVKTTQDNVWQLQRIAGTVVARAHEAIDKAGASPEANKTELDKAREFVRKAQWFWDIVASENSMGFHNPPQVLNALGQSIDLAHQAISTANRGTKISD